MNNDDILKQLNNPEFKIDLVKLLWEIHKVNTNNSYYLNQLLRTQLEIKELLQGKTGQEAESSAKAKFVELMSDFERFLVEDLTSDLNDLQV